VERLMTLINELDQDVEIVNRAKPRSHASRIIVSSADPGAFSPLRDFKARTFFWLAFALNSFFG
jgi:hypothetical protein